MFQNPLDTRLKKILALLLCGVMPGIVAKEGVAAPAPVLVTTASGEVIDKGLALARETARRDSGYGNIVAIGEIVNRSPGGEENRRVFEMITVEVEGDGDRRFVRVSEPASLRGTLFLSHAHALKADDVWLMLPRSHRLRRISAQDKTGRFLSSELTLEDISPWEVKKFHYRYQGTDRCGQDRQNHCHVIENTPAYKHSGYLRQLEWLDSNIYQPRRIEYYDSANRLLKVLEFNDYQQLGQRYWRPRHMKMTNVQSGAESEIHWRQYHLDTGYQASQLSPANMAKLRR